MIDGLNQAWLIYIILAFSELLNSEKPINVLNQIVIPTGKDAGVSQCSKISPRTVQGSAAHGCHPHSSFQLSSLPHSPFMGKPFSWLLGDWHTTTESHSWRFFWNPSVLTSRFESLLYQLPVLWPWAGHLASLTLFLPQWKGYEYL